VKQLKRFPDPARFTEFEYLPFEGGFELRSRFKRMVKLAPPVGLTIGARPNTR